MKRSLLFFGCTAAIFLTVSLGAAADDSQDCISLGKEVEARGGKLSSPIPLSWSQAQFSDPRAHDPKKFVYIVHVVGSNTYDLQNPDFGTFVYHIWASIISNDVPYTYYVGSGLILAIEPDNIVSNSCVDTTFRISPSAEEEGFEKYRQLHSPLNPAQMLLATSWPRWMDAETATKFAQVRSEHYRNNEILLKARSNSGNVVQTIGVFINLHDQYLPTIEALKSFAKKYELPIVEINP